MDTKSCPRCAQVLPTEQFNVKKLAANGSPIFQPLCKVCNRAYQRQHYLDNKEVYKAKAKAYDKKAGEQNFANLLKYLALHPCVDCGEPDPVVSEFDHREQSEKKASVATLLAVVRASWATIQREIDKCDVRCANCHKRRTAKQLGWRKAALLA